MNPELNDSSNPPQTNEVSPPHPVDETITAPAESDPASRAEMESSVLDALRPLLRAKRKKKDGDEGELEAEASADEPSAPAPAPSADAFFPSLPTSSELFSDRSGPVEKARALAEDELESFASIGEELERRSRQSATMVRVLEQHRQQLEAAEKQRDDAYDKLARVVPVVQETGQALREAMEARKVDDDPARMHKLFMLNGRALDELEKVAVDLFADFLWCKSAWEQYARSVEDARRLRSQLDV